MTCTRCGNPTDGVELSPGCRSACCPACHAAGVAPPRTGTPSADRKRPRKPKAPTPATPPTKPRKSRTP
jgi:hypothetical protein